MQKESIRKEILDCKNNNILLELPTSYGKSKLAIDKLEQYILNNINPKILIFVPRIVLIENWEQEFKKWNKQSYLKYITFSTYASIHKNTGNWDIIIFDESHHLTERCFDNLKYYSFNKSILLSATVKRNTKYLITSFFSNIKIFSTTIKEAINQEVLPNPKVFLIPLYLNTDNNSEIIIKNPKKKKEINCLYQNRWQYLKNKEYKINIYCTQKQYLLDLNNQIEYFKKQYMYTKNEILKNRWLYLSGERLKWLSNKKIPYIQTILKKVETERTLVFCNNIAQTEYLGKYCINSKNKQSSKYLNDFNNKKIHHITACNMLNEGMNLVDCRIGIYANLNSSETIIKQRLGRLLRHKNPIIIIPYYKDTREEELVNKMLEDYDEELITIISDIKNLKI